MNESAWESADQVGRMFEALQQRRFSAEAIRLLVLRLTRGDDKIERLTSDARFERVVYNNMIDTFLTPGDQRPAGWYGESFEHVYNTIGRTEGLNLQRHHADLIREQIGSPFRPFSIRWAWLTTDVNALAVCIRDESAFDRLPILADALQDAGCDDDRILGHCRRTDKPHHPGCWLLAQLGQAQRNVANNSSRARLIALCDRLSRRMVRAAVVYLAARLALDEDFLDVVTGAPGRPGHQNVRDFQTPEFVSACALLREATESGEPLDSYLSTMRDWHVRGFDECRLIREFMPKPPA